MNQPAGAALNGAASERELRERVRPHPEARGSFVVDGLRLAYEIHGRAGPLLVMLPGVGFPRVYFRPLAAHLRERVRCALLDTRGAGDSEGPSDPARYDLEGQASDVVALLDTLGEERAWLVGHSLGSNIAIACAARFPARVHGIVVISAALAVELIEEHLREVLRSADPALREIVERYEARGPVFVDGGPPDEYGVASSRIYQRHVVKSDVDSDVLWAMRQAIGPASALWGKESAFRVTGLLRKVDQRATVATIACPLVTIAGRDDLYARTSLPFLERASKGHVVLLPDSLHHAHVEEPARVAEIVLATLFPRAPDAVSPLRLDVTVEVDDELVRLTDQMTGFSFALPAAGAAALAALGRPKAEIVDALAASLGDNAPDAETLRAALDDMLAQLHALGLLQQGRTRADIDRAQKESRAESRVAERFADVVTAVTHAFERVPLYRERMEAAGVSPADLYGPAGLTRIPPLTKAEVRRHFPDGLVARGVDVKELIAQGAVTIGATSGTSDERLQVLFDWSKGGLPERARELWALPENAPLSTGAVFTTPLCAGFECHLGATTPAQRTRGTTLTLNSSEELFGLSDDEVRAIVGELAAHRPDVLFLHPWYGAWLWTRARALGLTLHRPTVVLTSYQLLTQRHKKLLREGFGAPVYSYWGATDLGGPLLGVECHHGNVHVREDQVFLEVEAPPGERGTILVTLLHDPVMPLVRYRISDVVRVRESPCACALGGEWQTVELHGRARDCLRAADGRVLTTRDIDLALGDGGPDFWRLVQRSPTTFNLEALGALDEEPRARLLAALGAGAELGVTPVKRFSPERSLKFRQTMSELASPFAVDG